MIVDRKWFQRNIGFNPATEPAPITTYAFSKAAKTLEPEDLQREIIDFDSDAPSGREFLAYTTATGLSRFTEIDWPKGLAPKTDKTARKGDGGALPRADILVVTLTVDEGHALSRVLTPGKDSRNDYVSYTRNFSRLAKKMRAGLSGSQNQSTGSLLDLEDSEEDDRRIQVRLAHVAGRPVVTQKLRASIVNSGTRLNEQ